jgi:hypothetical protein
MTEREWELGNKEFIDKYYSDNPPFCPEVIGFLLKFSNSNGGTNADTNKIIEKICKMIERRTKPFKSDRRRCFEAQMPTTKKICGYSQYAKNIQK